MITDDDTESEGTSSGTSMSTANPKGISRNEWDVLLDKGYFNEDEVICLQAYRGFRPLLPLKWSLEVVQEAALGPGATVRHPLASSSPQQLLRHALPFLHTPVELLAQELLPTVRADEDEPRQNRRASRA